MSEQHYTITPLKWSGRITFQPADGYPDGLIDCKVAPFDITGNIDGWDTETEIFTRPIKEEKYCLSWCMVEYHDQWMRHFRTVREAKEFAWNYWVEYLERSLTKVMEAL